MALVYISLQFSIIFIDLEGTPIQEASALEMDFETREIVDAFHKHARCNNDDDVWARKNVHGLNLTFLNKYGLDSSSELIKE